MSLAIIQLISGDATRKHFRIDTGTNPWYMLKVGNGILFEDGVDKLENTVYETSVRKNEKSNGPLQSTLLVSLNQEIFTNENRQIQLISFKDTRGTSATYSKIIKVPAGIRMPVSPVDEYSFSASVKRNNMSEYILNGHRNIPYSENKPCSDKRLKRTRMLKEVVAIAVPLIVAMLAAKRKHRGNPKAGIGMLNLMIDKLMYGVDQPVVVPRLATIQSIGRKRKKISSGFFRYAGFNRTMTAETVTAVAPVEVTKPPGAITNQPPSMPDMGDDAMIKAIMDDLKKDALLKLFLDANESDSTPDIKKILALLEGDAVAVVPSVPPTTNVTTAPALPTTNLPVPTTTTSPAPVTNGSAKTENGSAIATATSLSRRRMASSLSQEAILVFESSVKLKVNDADVAVYVNTGEIVTRLKLEVAGTPPKSALPKAIFSFIIKNQNDKTCLEKVFKQKEISAGTTLDFVLTHDEVKALPLNEPLMLLAEMRWLINNQKERRALGSMPVMITAQYLPGKLGSKKGIEKELTDMTTYRSFWNKVWESPIADRVSEDAANKKLWLIECEMKYHIALSGISNSNGLMETSVVKAADDSSGVTEALKGRMKAGIELSITELYKLNKLWQPAASDDTNPANAIRAIPELTNYKTEAICYLKMKGKMREQAMIWIVPVLQQFECTLQKVKATNDTGLVTETEIESVLIPLPVNLRVLGIKSI